ncbi:hypothetical protein DNR46_20475 [Mesorhizobium japonicum]|uniref:Uncharacterized protein n=1 Tax=Mesorhizobium japonicum TaxID=2066070 RepID=A0A3M9X7I0_9HYPH|nr:hypothetical protein DNR46_20475 [Mesorhizobium japonicum]
MLLAIAGNANRFVILGRSKERSDAAQTLESMPRLKSDTAAQNSASLHSSAKVAAWILGSARPLRSRSARG